MSAEVLRGYSAVFESGHYNSDIAANCFDGNDGTKWEGTADNSWVCVDLGSGFWAKVDTLKLKPRACGNAQCKDFILYGSNNSTDGVDDRITLPDTADMTFGTNDLTITAFVTPTTGSGSTILANCNSSGQNASMSTRVTLGEFTIFAGSTTYGSSITAPAADTPCVLSGKCEGTNSKAYDDGVLIDTDAIGAITVNDSAEPLTIGRNGTYNGWYFKGNMHEIRISNGVARSDAWLKAEALALRNELVTLADYSVATIIKLRRFAMCI